MSFQPPPSRCISSSSTTFLPSFLLPSLLHAHSVPLCIGRATLQYKPYSHGPASIAVAALSRPRTRTYVCDSRTRTCLAIQPPSARPPSEPRLGRVCNLRPTARPTHRPTVSPRASASLSSSLARGSSVIAIPDRRRRQRRRSLRAGGRAADERRTGGERERPTDGWRRRAKVRKTREERGEERREATARQTESERASRSSWLGAITRCRSVQGLVAAASVAVVASEWEVEAKGLTERAD